MANHLGEFFSGGGGGIFLAEWKLHRVSSFSTSFPGSLILPHPSLLAPGGGKMGGPGNEIDASWDLLSRMASAVKI